MYTVQIDVKLSEISKRDDQLELLNLLLSGWRMNGQVLNNVFPIAQKDESYSVFIQIPDNDSLSSIYSNKYVSNYLKRFEDEFSVPEILVLGFDPESSTICNCKTSHSYILYTTYLSIDSPLN
mgnify:CR=1 FL=1